MRTVWMDMAAEEDAAIVIQSYSLRQHYVRDK